MMKVATPSINNSFVLVLVDHSVLKTDKLEHYKVNIYARFFFWKIGNSYFFSQRVLSNLSFDKASEPISLKIPGSKIKTIQILYY